MSKYEPLWKYLKDNNKENIPIIIGLKIKTYQIIKHLHLKNGKKNKSNLTKVLKR